MDSTQLDIGVFLDGIALPLVTVPRPFLLGINLWSCFVCMAPLFTH